MSYAQNLKIKNISIFGLEGSKIAVLGDNITTLVNFDYFESIFEPVFEFQITFVSIDNALSDLKLRGTERVSLEIEHESGVLEFDDLVLTAFVQNGSESSANSFTVQLNPQGIINNEKERVVKRYDPKIKASVHVENILKSQIKETDELDIEETANSDGFYGNYWKPFKAIYWLARRAMSGSMPEDGDGTDRVGFLFWMTKSGYKFKSIDTIISDGKKNGVITYTQHEALSDNPDFDLHDPTFEFDQNIINQMMSSVYGERRSYLNLHTLMTTGEAPFSKENSKQAHLGDEELPDMRFEINGNPTRVVRFAIVDASMRKDGTIASADGEYNPHKIRSQSRMRYQSLLSRSLKITVPMNFELEAGNLINVKLIHSMKGTDEWTSGFYLIKNLRHNVQFNDNGLQCYTYLRLVRDTPGDD